MSFHGRGFNFSTTEHPNALAGAYQSSQYTHPGSALYSTTSETFRTSGSNVRIERSPQLYTSAAPRIIQPADNDHYSYTTRNAASNYSSQETLSSRQLAQANTYRIPSAPGTQYSGYGENPLMRERFANRDFELPNSASPITPRGWNLEASPYFAVRNSPSSVNHVSSSTPRIQSERIFRNSPPPDFKDFSSPTPRIQMERNISPQILPISRYVSQFAPQTIIGDGSHERGAPTFASQILKEVATPYILPYEQSSRGGRPTCLAQSSQTVAIDGSRMISSLDRAPPERTSNSSGNTRFERARPERSWNASDNDSLALIEEDRSIKTRQTNSALKRSELDTRVSRSADTTGVIRITLAQKEMEEKLKRDQQNGSLAAMNGHSDKGANRGDSDVEQKLKTGFSGRESERSSNVQRDENFDTRLADETKILVKIVKAENLLAKDKGDTSDPFAEIALGKQIHRTKTIEKSLNPEWNETFQFDCSSGDQMLDINLYDFDKGMLYGSAKEYLGSVQIPLRRAIAGFQEERWYDLKYDSKYQKKEEAITGRVLIAVFHPFQSASQESRKDELSFTVILLRGEGLLAKDKGGTSDPFAEILLGDQKKVSTVKEKTLNPEWNERIEFNPCREDEVFNIIIYDSDKSYLYGSSREYLGSVSIPVKTLENKTGPNWYNLGYDSRFQKKIEQMSGRVLIDFIAARSPAVHKAIHPKKDSQPKSKLAISVHQAENLLAKDKGGTSDPFVELRVGNQVQKTSVKERNLNPQWNENFEFECSSEENILDIVVYDQDKGLIFGASKEYLGSISIKVRDLRTQNVREQWFELKYDSNFQKKREEIKGRILISIAVIDAFSSSNGGVNNKISQQLKPAVPIGDIVVHVLKAEGLLAKDKGGTSDPFVELKIGHQQKTTSAVEKTLNPVWNEHHEFSCGADDEELDVVLYDRDKGVLYGASKEYLGSVSVRIRDLLQNGERWFNLAYHAKYQRMQEAITGRILLGISPASEKIAATQEKATLAQKPIADRRHTVPIGPITVMIVKAEGLLAKDAGGTSDPFAEVWLGKKVKKTTVREKTLRPVWNERFDIDCGPEEDNVDIVLYDNDKGVLYGNSKEYLGSVSVAIRDVLDREESWFDLSYDKKYQSKIEAITGRVLVKISRRSSPAPAEKLSPQGAAVPPPAKLPSQNAAPPPPPAPKEPPPPLLVVTLARISEVDGSRRLPTSLSVEFRIGKQIKTSNQSKALEWKQDFEFNLPSQKAKLDVVLFSHEKEHPVPYGSTQISLLELKFNKPLEKGYRIKLDESIESEMDSSNVEIKLILALYP